MLDGLRTDKHVAVFELVNQMTNCYYIDFSLNAVLEVDKILEELREGQCANKKLQKDWNRYGHTAFKLNIIEDFSEFQFEEHYSEEDELIKVLYDKMLGTMAKRKRSGLALYNDHTPIDYEKLVRKYFAYTAEGKRVIKPYKQKVILDEATQWAIYITNEKDFPPHSHEEIELIYVIDNEIDITINNSKYHLRPRDILFVSSKDIHSFTTAGEMCNRAVLVFKAPLIGEVFEFFTHQRPDNPFIAYEASEEQHKMMHGYLEKQILEIIDEYKHKQGVYTLAITARIYNILTMIVRSMTFIHYSTAEAKQLYKEIETAQKVLSYVNKHYEESITLEHGAKVSGYSLYHFTRFFKKMTGMTFNEYLTSLRIQKSSEILLETEKPITEIAYLCGFNSIKTYNRVFKEFKKMSPREFRKSNK